MSKQINVPEGPPQKQADDTCTMLRDSKVTKRKEGVKVLEVLLDSTEFLQAMDQATLLLQASSKPHVGTWPGLCTILCQLLRTEVESSKTKKRGGVDTNLPRVLRKFVRLAEEGQQRSGQQAMLLRRLPKLVGTLQEVMRQVGLAPGLGAECSTILRVHIVSVPAYCQVIPCSMRQELLDTYMLHLEHHVGQDQAEDTLRHATTLLLLLKRAPADLPALFQDETIDFFAHVLTKLMESKSKEDVRITTTLLAALNAFLLDNGVDVAEKALELHQRLHPLLMRFWRQPRDVKLRDTWLLYLEIQLRLGTLQACPGLAKQLYTLMCDHLGGLTFSWGEPDRTGNLLLSPSQTAFARAMVGMVQLLEEVPAQREQGPDADDAEEDPEIFSQAKRQKVLSPREAMFQGVLDMPALWGPVLAALLQRHAEKLPQDVLLEWQRRLLPLLQQEFGFAGQMDAAATSRLLWLLRSMHGLAVAWPTQLQHLTPEEEAGVAVNWKVVWEGTTSWLLGTHLPTACQAAGCGLLAAVAGRALAPNLPVRARKLWDLLSLRQPSSREAALCLVATAFREGGARDLTLRQELLDFVLEDSPHSLQPSLCPVTVSATLALVSMRPQLGAAACPVPECTWSATAEDETEAKLLYLMPGGQLMHAERKSMEQQRLRQPAKAAGGAAWQLGDAAAEALASRLQTAHDSPAADLQQLLCEATVALRLLVAAAGTPMGLEATWHKHDALHGPLQAALQQISELLIAQIRARQPIMAQDEQQLCIIVAEVGQLPHTAGLQELSRPLSELLSQAGQLFVEADTLMTAGQVQAAAAASSPQDMDMDLGAVPGPVQLFDDDLDMAGPVMQPVAASRSLADSAPAISPMATSCRLSCLKLMSALMPVDPARVFEVSDELLDTAAEAEGVLPEEEVLHHLVRNLCSTAARADKVQLAVEWLGESEGGLLESRAFLAHIHLLAQQQLELLAHTFSREHGLEEGRQRFDQLSAEHQAQFKAMVGLLGVLTERQQQADNLDDHPRSTVQLRVQQARTMLAFMQINRASLKSSLLESCRRAVIALASDGSYAARREAAWLAPLLLQQCDKPEAAFADYTSQMVLASLAEQPEQRQAAQHTETAVLLLAQIAISSSVVEREAIFLLCGHAARCLGHSTLVTRALDLIAAGLLYPSRHSLMAWHLPTLLFDLGCSSYTLAQLVGIQALLAISASGQQDEAAFLKPLVPHLVTMLLMAQAGDQLEHLARLTGKSSRGLVSDNFKHVLGVAMALRSASPAGLQIASELLSGQLIKQLLPDIDSLIKETTILSVVQIMLLARDETEPRLPLVPVRSTQDAVMQVAHKSVLWDQLLTGQGIAALLLAVHERLQQACHPRHKLQVMASMQAVVRLLGPRVTSPPVFKYLTHILLQQVQVRALHAVCAEILDSVFGSMLRDKALLPHLGTMLQRILFDLLKALEQPDEEQGQSAGGGMLLRQGTHWALGGQQPHADPAQAPAQRPAADASTCSEGQNLSADHPLVKLVLRLTVEAPDDLHTFFRDAQPLPNWPVLREACRLQQTLQQSLSLAAQLQFFAQHAAAMTPALMQHSLVLLTDALHRRSHELLRNGEGPVQGRSQALRCCAPEAEAAAWRLAQLGQELGLASLTAFAGMLLALFGPLEPTTVAFTLPSSPAQLLAAASSQDSQGGSGSSHSSRADKATDKDPVPGAASVQAVLVTAMGMMADYLIDQDVGVIRVTHNTLLHLLTTEAGQEALGAVPDIKQSHLRVHLPARGSQQPQQRPAAGAGPSLAAKRLWVCSSGQYELWVCRLAHALLLHASNPTLRAFEHLAPRKAAVAELLLPHVVADIALHSADATLHDLISDQVSTWILGTAPNSSNSSALPPAATSPSPVGSPSAPAPDQPAVDAKAVSLWLACLDHLRNIHLDSKLGLNLPDASPLGALGGSVRSSRAAKTLAEPVEQPSDWASVYWLRCNYLDVAAAALRCSACFTALLYVEYWCEQRYGSMQLGEENPLEGGLACHEQLLLDIYSRIGEPDGIYAVARSHNLLSQLHVFEHEGSWHNALAVQDILSRQTSFAGGGPDTGARVRPQELACAQSLGCQHLIACVTQGTHVSGSPAMAELQQEVAWRMGSWQPLEDQGPSSGPATQDIGINSAIRAGLQALVSGDREQCSGVLAAARQSVVRALVSVSTESSANVNPAVLQLQQLSAIEAAWGVKWPQMQLQPQVPTVQAAWQPAKNSQQPKLSLARLNDKWRQQEAEAGAGGRYQLQEPLFALHKILFQLLDSPSLTVDALQRTAAAARKAGRLTHAMGAIHELRAIVEQGKHRREQWAVEAGSASASWHVEEAKLLWAQQRHQVALRVVRALLAAKVSWPTLQQAQLRSLTGKWLAHASAEGSDAVRQLMRAAAEQLLQAREASGPAACRVMHRLAYYADTLYKGIQLQRASPEWDTVRGFIETKQKQVNQLKAQLKDREQRGMAKQNHEGKYLDRDSAMLKHQIGQLQRPIDHEQQERAALEQNEADYLKAAIENYGRCLVAGDKYDLQVVFRLCQLWFKHGTQGAVNAQLQTTFGHTPSYKFLCLSYQMASRLSSAAAGPLVSSGFQRTLQAMLRRMAVEHPYHVLYHLFALANGDTGDDGKKISQATSKAAMELNIDHEKVAAAKSVIESVKAHSSSRKQIVEQINSMIETYISLAAAPVPKDVPKVAMPSSIKRGARALPLVPIVSVCVPVDPAGRYQGLAHFASFGPTIWFVGGVNRPKLVDCYDSHGHRHKQLVKSGNDDLRQDAVMQQFFELINRVLAGSASSASRKLRIATYKVVPFTHAAGLLEWIEETTPLLDVLTGPSKNFALSLHGRHACAKDYSHVQCWKALADEKQNPNITTLFARQQATFAKIYERFKPVLHHWFLEAFRQPSLWFERRLSFTRSTAVNSMAGYIIGLGDRHSSNILVHKGTAEVAHIDLGIAFEQGRFLNTPEQVPFRLTRDIVDGMGITGVEGVMRRCSEDTLRVLRQNKESLLTIIEVFIHDPLYKWALTPKGVQQRQRDDPNPGQQSRPSSASERGGPGAAAVSSTTENVLANADAERALLRIKHKLDGIDSGGGEARTVEGQVQQLLQEAQDPDRLCRMFPGWAPWL